MLLADERRPRRRDRSRLAGMSSGSVLVFHVAQGAGELDEQFVASDLEKILHCPAGTAANIFSERPMGWPLSETTAIGVQAVGDEFDDLVLERLLGRRRNGCGRSSPRARSRRGRVRWRRRRDRGSGSWRRRSRWMQPGTWAESHRLAFRLEEFPGLGGEGKGVDGHGEEAEGKGALAMRDLQIGGRISRGKAQKTQKRGCPSSAPFRFYPLPYLPSPISYLLSPPSDFLIALVKRRGTASVTNPARARAARESCQHLMDLSSLLTVEQIIPQMHANERWGAIVELVDLLVKVGQGARGGPRAWCSTRSSSARKR